VARRPAPRVLEARPRPVVLPPRAASDRVADDIPRRAVRAAPRAAVAAPRRALRVAPRAPAPPREPRARRADVDLREDDFLEPAVRLRDPDVAARAPDERRPFDDARGREADPRLGEGVMPPPGMALTAFFARSAIVPAAVVTTDPTVLAAVPTPEATVSTTPLSFSSAIAPPRRRTPSPRR
jgi:hypothetical protein